MISDHILRMDESTTMAFAARAIEMKGNGINVIDLTVGEPDFPTPENIKAAAIKAITENKTKYTLNAGLLELRIAIVGYLKNRFNIHYTPDQILISTGAKQGIFNAIQVLINEEDEVLIPAPYYPSHVQMVNFAGGDPVIIETSEGNNFKITPDLIQENVTHKTKALILCNPNNPTGAVYTKEELEKIAEAVIDHDLYVISDEVYEQLTYGDVAFTSFASISEEIKNRTVIANGVSKAYAMTGWRLGFTAATKKITEAMAKLQSHTTSCTNAPAQYAALEAFMTSQESVQEMRSEFEKRGNETYKDLLTIKNITCSKPAGAFYLFPNISAYLGKSFEGKTIANSTDLSLFLLESEKVAVVPGIGFGLDNHIRISYSTDTKILKEGIKRLKNGLKKLI